VPELKLAITILGIITAALVVLLLGDYLGYRIGRQKVASFAGISLLVSVVTFAIFAAIVLL
jgi:hypothetical protein